MLGAGCIVGIRAFMRARALMTLPSIADADTRQMMIAFNRLAPHHVQSAPLYAKGFAAGGVAAIIGAPVMWLAWRSTMGAKQKPMK